MAHVHDHQPPPNPGPAFCYAVTLNTGYLIAEAAAGWIIGSLAMLTDAAHDLTDVAGLLIALGGRSSGQGRGHGSPHLGAWTRNDSGRPSERHRHSGRRQRCAVGGSASPVRSGRCARADYHARGTDRHRREHRLGAFVQEIRQGRPERQGRLSALAANAAVSGAVVLVAAGILLTGWDWLDRFAVIAVTTGNAPGRSGRGLPST